MLAKVKSSSGRGHFVKHCGIFGGGIENRGLYQLRIYQFAKY